MGNARSQLPPQEVTTFNNDDVNAATDAHCDPSPVTAIQNVDTARKYTFQQIDGEFTVVDLAEMEFSRDDRFFKVRDHFDRRLIHFISKNVPLFPSPTQIENIIYYSYYDTPI